MSKTKTKAYLIYDDSGSIDTEKRAEYKKLYEQYDKEFDIIEMISHTTKAEFIVNLNDIAKKLVGSGGTYVSSGLACAYPHILSDLQDQYIEAINVYIIGDGGNWEEDIPKTLALMDELISKKVNITIVDIFANGKNKLADAIKNSERYKYRVNIRNISEPITPIEELNIYVRICGNETIATNCKTGTTGKATCKDGDTFDRTEGIRIAVNRAIGKDPFKTPLRPVEAEKTGSSFISALETVKKVSKVATYKPFNWADFKSRFKKIAVQCKTNEEVLDFLTACERHGAKALFHDTLLEWNKSRSLPLNKNCFAFDNSDKTLTYGSYDWYDIQGMNILQWSDYMVAKIDKFKDINDDELLEEVKRRMIN